MKCAYAIAVGNKARINELSLSSQEASWLTGYVKLGVVQLYVHAQLPFSVNFVLVLDL